MPALSWLWHFVWYARALALVLLTVVCVQRRFHREFPMFVLYLWWTALRTLTLVAMHFAPWVTGDQYFVTDTATFVVWAGLSFAVVYEICKRLFNNYPVLKSLGTNSFRWTTIILIAIAIALAWGVPARGTGRLVPTFHMLQRTQDLLLCGLLLFLFLFGRYFHVSWRSYAFGIALGLGVFAASDLGTYAIRSQIEPGRANLSTDVLELITQSADFCAVLIWIGYFFAPEWRPETTVNTLPNHDLETWNQELQRLLHQ